MPGNEEGTIPNQVVHQDNTEAVEVYRIAPWTQKR